MYEDEDGDGDDGGYDDKLLRSQLGVMSDYALGRQETMM